MNRSKYYPFIGMLDSDFLKLNRNIMISIGRLLSAIIGETTQLNGLSCIPTTIPSLDVQIIAGEIYDYQVVDATDYGSLPADTTHSCVKQGILTDSILLACPAPASPGQSINYLIEYTFLEIDGDNENRQFYNPSLPTPAYDQAVNMFRFDNVVPKALAGVPAATGTQSTPAPESGYVGGFVVTVDYAQTQINSGDIAYYPGNPILLEKLKDKISQAFADARYLQPIQLQSMTPIFSSAAGTANAITANFSPSIATYSNPLNLYIICPNTNTGAATFSPNGLTPKNITKEKNGIFVNLENGDIVSGGIYNLITEGGSPDFILMNPTNNNEFENSITTNGHQKLPSGFIIQWGKLSISPNGTDSRSIPTSFPIPFPNNIFSTSTTYHSTPSGTSNALCTGTQSLTTSGFNFVIDGIGTIMTNTVEASWIAIGN